MTDPDPKRSEATDENGYCRFRGEPIRRGAIAAERRACCLNATPIAGIRPTHGPLGPHHVVASPATDRSE